jgi:hypothetical protein
MNANTVSLERKSTTLQGGWLLIARITWLILVGLTLTVFIASLPTYFAQIQTICWAVTCPAWQITP